MKMLECDDERLQRSAAVVLYRITGNKETLIRLIVKNGFDTLIEAKKRTSDGATRQCIEQIPMSLKTKMDAHILNQHIDLILDGAMKVKRTIARAVSVIGSPFDLKRVFLETQGLDFLNNLDNSETDEGVQYVREATASFN